MNSQNANYIYIQISPEVHHDAERILSATDEKNLTIYISNLSESDLIIYNYFIDMINGKINENN